MWLKGLDGIRALCALFVLWGHMSQKDFVSWDITPLPLPECAAYVFFAISGVLAGFRIDSVSSPGDYYKKKAFRILPLYYTYILLSIVVFLSLGRTSEVINARLPYYLFLVPSIPFVLSQGILPLVHLWFIGTLILFYLFVPLLAKFNRRKQKILALVISAIWFAAKLLARLFGHGAVYRLIGCTCFDVLCLGVWCGLQLKDGTSLGNVKAVLISVFTWGLFLLSGLYGHIIPALVRIEFVSVLALIIIVTQQRQKFCFFLENKVARFLGGISYEIYVVHILVIILLSYVYQRLCLSTANWVIYLTSTLIVILVSYLMKVGISAVLKAYSCFVDSRQMFKS